MFSSCCALAINTFIEEGACIGPNTTIWHNSIVRKSAYIGDHCIIGSYVYIDNDVKIGDFCKVQNYSCIYSNVQIESNVFIGPRVTFTNVINPRSFIDRKSEFKPTIVGYGASIGAACTIVCGNTVGPYAFIGAGSVITKSVGLHELWIGLPAKKTGYYTRWGEHLPLPKSQKPVIYECPHTGDIYELNDLGMQNVIYGDTFK